MTLVPWKTPEALFTPSQAMEDLWQEMNRYFNFPFRTGLPGRMGLLEGAWSPAVDIFENRDNILVKAEIPGMEKEDLDVSVKDNVLVIKGEKKKESEVKEEGGVRSERYYGYFNRTLALPAYVDAANVKATYKNGVLELVLPKKEEAKSKQIKVESK